jgi:hypothetical protein
MLMGAINKVTEQYEYPRIAKKANKYICPDCKKDVILKKGAIRVHHFAHYKSENPCVYYNNPGESQIHKDAKMAFKTVLDSDINITFTRKCNCCKNNHKHNIDKKSEKSIIKLEHGFLFNNSHKKADIAYIEEEQIKYIFEICYKHKTSSDNRPEPWFEIDAEELLNSINNEKHSDNVIDVFCIRNQKCNDCILREIEEKEKWQQRQIEETEKRRLREAEQKERQRMREIEEKKYNDALRIRREKGAEFKKEIWAQHKRCSKCKSYERCSKCVDKLWKKHEKRMSDYINNIADNMIILKN